MLFIAPAKHANRTRAYGVVVLLLASFILLACAAWYSTVKAESTPAGAHSGRDDGSASPDDFFVQATAFAPFLNILPSQDGAELFISAGGVGELDGAVLANIDLGPGADKGGWTMTYSDTVRAYVTTATGFTPETSLSGAISITTTHGLDTGVVDFNRAYVPALTPQTINTIDGKLSLSLVLSDTLPSSTYIVAAPSYAPPGSPPAGHRIVGSTYSVRAAGALVVTNRPMSLRLYYDDTTLIGADPHTLAVFAWDAFHMRWDNVGGRLFCEQGYLSVPTSRFTTYALMATPVWRDEFNGFCGLAEWNDVTLGTQGGDLTLVLDSMAGSGGALSRYITPTTGFAGWDRLSFAGVDDPPTTTLSIDVLGPNGSGVLIDVTSGADLSNLDPAQYPSLRLRASLSSTAAEQTPALDQWQLSWQVEEHKVYLPFVLK